MQFFTATPGKITPKILSEQTRFSYDVFPVTISVLIIASCLITFLVWQQIDTKQAIYWSEAMGSIIALRILLYFSYRRYSKADQPKIWHQAFLIGAYLSAATISIAGLMFYNGLDQSSKMVFMLLVIGIVSGAMPVLAAEFKAYAI